MMTLIISSLLFIALGGALYMIRGGGFGDQYSDISTWLKNHNLPTPRNLFIVALLLLPMVSIPYLLVNGFHGLYFWMLVLSISAGYALSLMESWGTYYNMGFTTNPYYQNHRGILWIDWILCKIYGPELIPTGAVNPDPVAFDLIVSPTGQPNTFAWLRTRCITGMALRMLYTVILFGAIGFCRYHFMHDLHGALIATAMSLPMMLTAFIYAYFLTATSLANTTSSWRFEQPVGRSELVTGLLLHSLIVISLVA